LFDFLAELIPSAGAADYIFGAVAALVVGCNFYIGLRIKREHVAM
jgi:hypothetical protein